LNAIYKEKFQRAHGDINVEINNNDIKRFYQSGSAKVFYHKHNQSIKELVLVNTAGGLTSGDIFNYNIDAINHSETFVTTQTAERVYKGLEENAKINVNLTVDNSSNLYWIPQELILFNLCNLSRNIEVNLQPNSNFLLAESMIFGRTAMGEILEKGFIKDNWKIFLNKNLIHSEALSLTGNIKENLSNIASTQNGIAVCNFFIYGKKFLTKENDLIKLIKNSDDVFISHSNWNDKILVRIVAKDAYNLKILQKKLILCFSDNTLPKVWNN
jgi:urease accessory protein